MDVDVAGDLNPYIEKVESHPLILSEIEEVFAHFSEGHTVLDLGCGNGHFLQSYIDQHPELEIRGLGIDKRYKRLFKSAKKLVGTESRVFHYDVPSFVKESPGEYWNEVWLQFPDPWPKKRHAKNRMLTRQLFVQIFRTLKPGGRFCFRSDHIQYWKLLAELNSQTDLFAVSRISQQDIFLDCPTTLFRESFRSRDLPIYSAEFKKIGRASFDTEI